MFFKLKTSRPPLPRPDDDEDKDTRRRRRLSKPLTNKSSTNLLNLSAQKAEGQASNSSALDVSPASPAASPSHENAGEVVHSLESDSKPHIAPAKSSTLGEDVVWQGTASLPCDDAAHDNGSPTLLSPKGSMKAKRPMSAIFTTPRLSSSRTSFARRRASLQALTEGHSDTAEKNIRPAATLPLSSENQSDALCIRRKSSFAPGVATRTSRTASLGPPPVEEQSEAARKYYYDSNLSEESPLGQLEVLDFDEEWAPPAPPVARSETPSDLDYTHLGGLRLGSLRVTNGRASPAPSELSRHLTGASAPNLKRDASSEYGDGDDGALVTLASLRLKSYRGRDQGLQVSTPVPQRPVAAPPRTYSDTLLLPKRGRGVIDTLSDSKGPTSGWATAQKVDTPPSQAVSHTFNRTSELAMAYMAELSASPYSDVRPPSPAESVLKSTSKATEFDDHLFEDDAAAISPSGEVDDPTLGTQWSHNSHNDPVWVYEDAYRTSVRRSRDTSPRSSLQPSNSTGSSVKPDSGYGSKISLESPKDQKYDAPSKIDSLAPTELPARTRAVDIEADSGRSEPHRNSFPLRPSILKRNGNTAPQLPNFSNLYSSTTTLATINSTSSAPSEAPTKSRRLQKKARPRSQPPAVRQIVVQGDHEDMASNDIPPIPVEIVANLAIRTEQVPELGHTFSSMNHTRELESSPKAAYAPSLIDFPKSDATPRDSSVGIDMPAPPPHRTSFRKWSTTERRNSRRRASSGISEDDAMAIIHDLGAPVSSMGGSPYDIASKAIQSPKGQVATPQTSHDLYTKTYNAPRSRTMMDDATATEHARMRSRSIAERDDTQWKRRRNSFNDRGGIPGRNIRLFTPPEDAPPLPPLPSHGQVRQKQGRKVDYQKPYVETHATERRVWLEQRSFDRFESGAQALSSHSSCSMNINFEHDIPPPPPSHSPRPRSIELSEDIKEPPPPSHSPRPRSVRTSGEVLAPPPPPHSPRPMSFGSQEEETDIWASQASVWKSRRQSIGEMLRSRTAPPETHYYDHSLATQESANDDPVYPEIPLRIPQKSFTTGSEMYRTPDLDYQGAQSRLFAYEPAGHEQSSYKSFHGETFGEPRVRVGPAPDHTASYASTGEECYPPQYSYRQSLPQFGRYTDGLNYHYEHGAGFGGGASTRTITGCATAARRGVPLSEQFGVDLSDVPVMAVIRRKPVGS